MQPGEQSRTCSSRIRPHFLGDKKGINPHPWGLNVPHHWQMASLLKKGKQTRNILPSQTVTLAVTFIAPKPREGGKPDRRRRNMQMIKTIIFLGATLISHCRPTASCTAAFPLSPPPAMPYKSGN